MNLASSGLGPSGFATCQSVVLQPSYFPLTHQVARGFNKFRRLAGRKRSRSSNRTGEHAGWTPMTRGLQPAILPSRRNTRGSDLAETQRLPPPVAATFQEFQKPAASVAAPCQRKIQPAAPVAAASKRSRKSRSPVAAAGQTLLEGQTTLVCRVNTFPQGQTTRASENEAFPQGHATL